MIKRMIAVRNLLLILAVVSQVKGQLSWYRKPLHEEEPFIEEVTLGHDGRFTRFHWPLVLESYLDPIIAHRPNPFSDNDGVFEAYRSIKNIIPYESWLLPILIRQLERSREAYIEEISNRYLWIFRFTNMYRAAVDNAVNDALMASEFGTSLGHSAGAKT